MFSSAKKCKQCGAKLVLKKGKHGQFWGCSDYRNCKKKQMSKYSGKVLLLMFGVLVLVLGWAWLTQGA